MNPKYMRIGIERSIQTEQFNSYFSPHPGAQPILVCK